MTMSTVLYIALWLVVITGSAIIHHITLRPGIRATQQQPEKAIAHALRLGERILLPCSVFLWTPLTLGQVLLPESSLSIYASSRSSLIAAYVATYLLFALLSWRAVAYQRRNEDTT